MNRIKKASNILSEEGPIELSKRTWNHISGKLEPSEDTKYWLWEKGVLEFDSMYNKEYYEELSRNERVDNVEQLCDVIYTKYEPDSIIDLGCGPGVFLNQFYKRDVTVRGIDNSEEAFEVSPIPEEYLIKHDLRQPYSVEQKYDLTICIELLEHLSEEHADTLVNTIVESGEIIIVSAAYPGQGGQIHINEKPQDYWISKFESEGVVYDKNSSKSIINQVNLDALNFIEDTLMVFKQK